MADPISAADPVSVAEAKAKQERRAEKNRKLRLDSRLSFPFVFRLPLATTMAFVAGMGLGVSHGSTMAGLRFRAENAHRLPETQTGWYLYHKTKNYKMAYGGVREGMRMGLKLSFWVAGFFGVEEIFDRWRGTKDFVNTTIASLTVAGVFSAYNRFPITTAARTAKTGLAIGITYGLVQDALSSAKGRNPRYVDFLLRRSQQQQTSSDTEREIVL